VEFLCFDQKLTTRGLSYSEGVPLEQTQANDEVFLVYWTLLRNVLLVWRPTTTWEFLCVDL